MKRLSNESQEQELGGFPKTTFSRLAEKITSNVCGSCSVPQIIHFVSETREAIYMNETVWFYDVTNDK